MPSPTRLFQVGDRVAFKARNRKFEGPATVIATCPGSKHAKHQVRMDYLAIPPFWALDEEVSPLPEPDQPESPTV